jgi:Ca2+-transporting ATPase
VRDTVHWHALTVAETLERLGTSLDGLATREAERRLQQFGPNEIETAPPPSLLRIILRQFKSPLIYILLVAALVTAGLGEWIDTGAIFAVLLINAALGTYHELRAEQAIRSLMLYLSPRARVIRDGVEREIPAKSLVPGDIVLLESGIRVPADLRLVSTTALMVDESVFTGESVPVVKHPDPVPPETPIADRVCMAFLGTIVTSGRGVGVVVSTGRATELGKIAHLARAETQPQTPLERQFARFARLVALVVLVSIVAISSFGVLRGDEPALLFKFAVGAAVAIVPEGLPIVVTLVLAVSAQRMARRRAIVRHLAAVETLGSTTVIGSDKTGTLTENRMTVRALWAAERVISFEDEQLDPVPHLSFSALRETAFSDLPPPLRVLVTGVLANEATLAHSEEIGQERAGIGDPTDLALLIAGARFGLVREELESIYPILAEIPFEPERRFAAVVSRIDGKPVFLAKGAPERILDMCSTWVSPEGLVPLDREAILAAAHQLAQQGLRVLGFAAGEIPFEHAERIESLLEPSGLTFLGLVGLWDPPRAGVREAIASCHSAGIRVVMITGDHAATAAAIADFLGIAPRSSPVLTGRELQRLSDEELRSIVQQVSVFARVEPEQKLRIVRALQANGETVAVTGDGVNDAPALRAAEIGVAMGKSGTDVAREAADIVLTDDNFVTIVAAVEEGRGAFDNLRKATFFLISTGAAMLFVLPFAVLAGWPLPFYPAQLLWLNLVTNGLQDVAMAFEPKEPGLMRRRPRPRREGILSPLLWERTLLSGLVMAAGTLWIFDWTLRASGSLDLARTVALTTMMIFQNFQVGNARSSIRSLFRMSPFSNRVLFAAVIAAIIVHVGALYVPLTQFVLRVEPIPLDIWPRIILVASTILAVVEVHKWLRRRWPRRDSWETSEVLGEPTRRPTMQPARQATPEA